MNADELIDKYLEEKDYTENRKPYWLFVDAQKNLQYRLFNYFPEAHYKNAIDQALEQEAEERVRDNRRTHHYYRDDE